LGNIATLGSSTLGNFANLTGYADAMQQYVREEFASDAAMERLRAK